MNLNWNYTLTFDDLINNLIQDEIKYQEWLNRHLI